MLKQKTIDFLVAACYAIDIKRRTDENKLIGNETQFGKVELGLSRYEGERMSHKKSSD